MIDKFKKWLAGNKKGTNISYAPKQVGTDIEEFKVESENILSYLLDSGDIFITIDKYLYEYKVALRVTQEDFGDMQDFHEAINGWDTKDFNDVKDDFISYIMYINRKYIIDPKINIGNENNFSSKEYSIKELEYIPNLKFSYISFYIRK